MYRTAVFHRMTCAISLGLKVPLEFNRMFLKLSRLFFRSNPTEGDL